MKNKFLAVSFILAILLSAPKAFCANFSNDFIYKFSKCSPYVYDTGAKIRQIIGWTNDSCYYREITSSRVIDCQFDKKQVIELTNAMRKDRKVSTPSKITIGGFSYVYNTGWSGLDAWKKYLDAPIGACSVIKDDTPKVKEE